MECSSILPDIVDIPCGECNYTPPRIKRLLIRKTKKGQFQVKINGKGKWFGAEYNEERKTITFSA